VPVLDPLLSFIVTNLILYKMVEAIKHCLRLGLQFSIFAIMSVEFMSLRLICLKRLIM
jgi:hypothetical protein